jgi:hypothetical protein
MIDMFRWFQPLRNPIGFGASDFIEFTLAALLVLFLLLRPHIQPHFKTFAERTFWCMLLLAVLPIAMRLALLPHHPVPTPELYDEYSHLLVGDTLRHFRFSNPIHPLHAFFETFFVLQEPSYSSIYPIGQGLALAVGRILFGNPWAGVVLSVSAFCSLCYWMLRGWTTPAWALAGGLLAVCEFGPLNQWMNSYWGGGVSAAAGCLVFGALPRLGDGERSRSGNALLLGAGIGLHVLTRPYESVFLVFGVLLYFAMVLRKHLPLPLLARTAAMAALAMLPALGLTLLHNQQVTGNWLTVPAMLSRFQYGVPTTFTVEPNPIPHRPLTPQQELSYRSQVSYHGEGTDTSARFLSRLVYRIRFYRFFFLPVFYLGLLAFLLRLLERRALWLATTLAIFALGANFYPFFFPHYIAGATCLFLLVTVMGLERWGRRLAPILLFLGVVHFLFWYSLHLSEGQDFGQAMLRFETWNSIHQVNAERRILIRDLLTAAPGRQLVFVRYGPQHIFQDEWVYNEADIDGARIVWARDLGSSENDKLRRYYPDRTVWLLEPDSRPPALNPYVPEPIPGPLKPAADEPKPTAAKPSKPVLKFEEVPEAR